MIFLISQGKICCDYSLEPSRQGGSNDRSQICFLRNNMDKYPKIIPITYSDLEDCC